MPLILPKLGIQATKWPPHAQWARPAGHQSLNRDQLSPKILSDQLPMKSSVLNKNLIRAFTRHNHASKINPWNITLQRRRITDRATIIRLIEPHPKPLDKTKVRMVSRQRKHKLIRKRHLPVRRADRNLVL